MDFLQINQALFFYYQHIVTFSGNPILAQDQHFYCLDEIFAFPGSFDLAEIDAAGYYSPGYILSIPLNRVMSKRLLLIH